MPTEAIVTLQGQDYIFMVTDKHGKTNPMNQERYSKEWSQRSQAWQQWRKKGVAFEIIPVVKRTSEVGYTQITPAERNTERCEDCGEGSLL